MMLLKSSEEKAFQCITVNGIRTMLIPDGSRKTASQAEPKSRKYHRQKEEPMIEDMILMPAHPCSNSEGQRCS